MIETIVLYPKPRETYQVHGKREMTWLREGEYDLVNISLIGHDPVTGRSRVDRVQ